MQLVMKRLRANQRFWLRFALLFCNYPGLKGYRF
jgi:hypothetical protein